MTTQPGPADAPPDARSLAAHFRTARHLGTAPIADLVTVLEDDPLVHVAVLPAVEGDHHGMRATDPLRGVTVLAAAATPHPVRLRSTLAHELGHHLFDDPTPTTWSARTPEENRATEFARHLLIPIEGLLEILGHPGDREITETLLSGIVERFRVSPHMAAIQLREAGYIDRDTEDRFAALSTPVLATRHGWRSLYNQWSAESQTPRPPRRIVEAAINAYIGGNATIETIAQLLDTHEDAVRAELTEAGIEPVQSRQGEGVEDDFDWALLAHETPERA